MIKRILFIFCVLFTLGSCAPKKRLVYFQGIDKTQSRSTSIYEPVLQPDDLLLIIVSAPDPEAAIPFNLVAFSYMDTSERASSGSRYQTYLVDNEGNIEFPVLGKVLVGGLSKIAAVEKLKEQLKRYINTPIVNIRIMNYKFSVMGEVARPGGFNVPTERITLPEALSMAGDLTIYGDRKNILVIREISGVQTHNVIDITSASFMNSDFYYLDQNDMIYVQPNQTRVNSSVVGPNISVIFSVISLLITVITLSTK